MTQASQKNAARKAGFALRKQAFQHGPDAAKQAAAHLLRWLCDKQFAVIAGYIPIRTEIDILPAMRLLHAKNIRLCVPVIQGKAKPLKFRQWTPQSTMIDGPFGAAIPEEGAWLVPDLVLCPLVAFDQRGHRLGYGGGFYDRSLAQIRSQQDVLALGYAFSSQKMPDLPIDATDEPLDGMVTEKGVRVLVQ